MLINDELKNKKALIPYSMNVRAIYEEISEISDNLHGTLTSYYRNDLIKRLYALVLELQRRFQV